MSRCTIIADWRLNVFNACPRFNCNSIALESRIDVLKLRTNFRLKFVRDLDTRVWPAVPQAHLWPCFERTRSVRDLRAVTPPPSAIQVQ